MYVAIFPNISFFSDICSLLVPGIRLRAARPYLRFPDPPRSGYNRVQCISFDALPVKIESGKPHPSQLKEILPEADPIAEIDAPKSTGTFWSNLYVTITLIHFSVDSQPVALSDQPIIRFGAETDIALERLKLQDSIIPHLRHLAYSTRSSKWEQTLRGPQWSFTYEQAVVISRAMIEDSIIANLKVCSYLVYCRWKLINLSERERSFEVRPHFWCKNCHLLQRHHFRPLVIFLYNHRVATRLFFMTC